MNKTKSSKKRYTRKQTKKVSKSIKAAIKQVVNRNVETKIINCPDAAGSGSVNTVFRPITANSGANYLVIDVFKQPQGTNDSSVIGSGNRVGDKVKGVGFMMDYFFTNNTSFTLAGNAYVIPYVKIRVVVFRQAFGTPLLPAPLLLDSNYLQLGGPTQRPINWDEGYIKDVLYDRVHICRTQANGMPLATGSLLNSPFSGLYRLKKYIKFPHNIKYCDNNSTTPNSTTNPINIVMFAECEEGFPFIPSTVNLTNVTGYTKAWFKDA